MRESSNLSFKRLFGAFAAFFACLLSSIDVGLFARQLEYQVQSVFAPSSEPLPFWLTHNQFGRYSEEQVSLLRSGVYERFSSEDPFAFSYAWGIEGSASFESNDRNFFLNQAYASLRWQHFRFDLGIQNPDERWYGLSASNTNILVGTNARALPSAKLSTGGYRPLPFIGEFLKFNLEYSESWLNDSRFVDNALLHQALAAVRIDPTPKLSFSFGFEHFAQWGGKGQPQSFTDYLRILTARSGGDNANAGDQINSLGNHLGRYFVEFRFEQSPFEIALNYNHFFEDGSGARFENFPDGLYGLLLGHKNENFKWLKTFVYEFYHTKDQSGPAHSPPEQNGKDNYFNNGIYRSGWTYQGRIRGAPFFTKAPTNSTGLVLGTINNRFVAHHFSVRGELPRQLHYQLMVSHSQNKGRFGSDTGFDRNQWSYGLALEPRVAKLPVSLGFEIAWDHGDLLEDGFGALISVSKRGLF